MSRAQRHLSSCASRHAEWGERNELNSAIANEDLTSVSTWARPHRFLTLCEPKSIRPVNHDAEDRDLSRGPSTCLPGKRAQDGRGNPQLACGCSPEVALGVGGACTVVRDGIDRAARPLQSREVKVQHERSPRLPARIGADRTGSPSTHSRCARAGVSSVARSWLQRAREARRARACALRFRRGAEDARSDGEWQYRRRHPRRPRHPFLSTANADIVTVIAIAPARCARVSPPKLTVKAVNLGLLTDPHIPRGEPSRSCSTGSRSVHHPKAGIGTEANTRGLQNPTARCQGATIRAKNGTLHTAVVAT
jgi:hypothetical protein